LPWNTIGVAAGGIRQFGTPGGWWSTFEFAAR